MADGDPARLVDLRDSAVRLVEDLGLPELAVRLADRLVGLPELAARLVDHLAGLPDLAVRLVDHLFLRDSAVPRLVDRLGFHASRHDGGSSSLRCADRSRGPA